MTATRRRGSRGRGGGVIQVLVAPRPLHVARAASSAHGHPASAQDRTPGEGIALVVIARRSDAAALEIGRDLRGAGYEVRQVRRASP